VIPTPNFMQIRPWDVLCDLASVILTTGIYRAMLAQSAVMRQ